MHENLSETVPFGIDCQEVYDSLSRQISILRKGRAITNTVADDNPFIEGPNPFRESRNVDFEEQVEHYFKDYSDNELKELKEFIYLLKQESHPFTVATRQNKEHFVFFLKSFYEKTKGIRSLPDKIISLLDNRGGKEFLQRIYKKHLNILFFFQPGRIVNFLVVSTIFKFIKMNLMEMPYLDRIYVQIYTAFASRIIYRHFGLIPRGSHIKKFKAIFDHSVNALNGAAQVFEMTEYEVETAIVVMMCFCCSKNSIFLENFSYKELFYCAVRSVREGRSFARELEIFLYTGLCWKMITDTTSYYLDTIYQTTFKYEYKKILGRIRRYKGLLEYSDSFNKVKLPDNSGLIVTNIIKSDMLNSTLSPKAFSVSPLSKRIGDANKNKESLNSSRRLRFD